MILIQIDTLSLNELQCIAQQEGIADFETLSREELIEELREIYEDDADSRESTSDVATVGKRFVSGLTDYRGDEATVDSLPGVEELPLVYPETSVHILSKNATWIYCYWSLSPLESEKYTEKYGSFDIILNVNVERPSGRNESFDIHVSENDLDWNINVPQGEGNVSVKLMIGTPSGERIAVASSEKLPLVFCYWLEHADEAVRSEDLIRRYLSILTTREGQLSSCLTVREIVDNIRTAEGL